MAKHETGTGLKQDEFSKIFDEYRAKIEEITRRTEKNLHTIEAKPGEGPTDEHEQIEVVSAQSQPDAAVDKDTQTQLENMLARPAGQPDEVENDDEIKDENAAPPPAEPPLKPEPVNSNNESEPRPLRESAEILDRARHEARQIIEEAEESAKKEAKKRTKSQVEKIIEKARKEAEEIVSSASKSAEKARDDVIAESKREADQIIREITLKYRQETETKASLAMTEAQEKAGKMLADISLSTAQVREHITQIVNRAKQTINELETSLQAEVVELTKIIAETQTKLDDVSKPTVQEDKYVPPPKQAGEVKIVPPANPTLGIRLIGEKSNSPAGNGMLFSGQMEMKSASASFDYQYLKKLKKYLVHIPKIKYLQEYASEKEMSVVFDILEPLPLLDILSNIPVVEEVITRADDDICLVFKTASE